MKQRIISALIALIIIIPIIIHGGTLFNVGASLIVKVLGVICFLLILVSNFDIVKDTLIENLDRISTSILLLITPIVFYHKSKKYDIEDALFLFGGAVFLALAFNNLISIRAFNINYFWFILIITTLTDTFAYITGYLIGSHKMIPSVSPKKTWEGFIGGTIMGTFTATMFYLRIFNFNGNILFLILIVMLLSMIGSIGDLVFSAIKRHYEIKDFGNIMPGHGGVLDRLDSILFVSLAFSYLSLFI